MAEVDQFKAKAMRVPDGGTGAYRAVDARANLGIIHTMQSSIEAKPGTSAVVLRGVAPVAMTLMSGGIYCAAASADASNASATFTIVKNSTTVGTIVFGASGKVGVFAVAADAAIAAGDVITITAPGSQDSALDKIAFALGFAY